MSQSSTPRIVFMGTPPYAVESLRALIANGFAVQAVITQPDRPAGRGGKTQLPPAKEFALAHGIPVIQPLRIRQDGVQPLRDLVPDLCVTAAFGQILSQEILEIPRLGTVNVHASLLPKYRGSSPANWCLINGETTTGVTTMMTDRGIDTGDILLQAQTEIDAEETAGELTRRLAVIGAQLLVDTIRQLLEGTCPRRAQDHAHMSYYPMLNKQMGRINWAWDARRLANLARGLNPWPCAYTASPHGTLKVLRACPEEGVTGARPGQILSADAKAGLVVACGTGALRVITLQAENSKAMPAQDYLRGHTLPVGQLICAAAQEEA